MTKTYLVSSKLPPADDCGTLLKSAFETAKTLKGADVTMVKYSAAQESMLYFAVHIPNPAVLEEFKARLGSTLAIGEWDDDPKSAVKRPRSPAPG